MRWTKTNREYILDSLTGQCGVRVDKSRNRINFDVYYLVACMPVSHRSSKTARSRKPLQSCSKDKHAGRLWPCSALNIASHVLVITSLRRTGHILLLVLFPIEVASFFFSLSFFPNRIIDIVMTTHYLKPWAHHVPPSSRHSIVVCWRRRMWVPEDLVGCSRRGFARYRYWQDWQYQREGEKKKLGPTLPTPCWLVKLKPSSKPGFSQNVTEAFHWPDKNRDTASHMRYSVQILK